jgi:hypothetical protein
MGFSAPRCHPPLFSRPCRDTIKTSHNQQQSQALHQAASAIAGDGPGKRSSSVQKDALERLQRILSDAGVGDDGGAYIMAVATDLNSFRKLFQNVFSSNDLKDPSF